MKLLTQSEVSEMLRVSDRTIENYRKKGLKFIKFSNGRGANKILFKENDVLEFINNHIQQEENGKAPVRTEWRCE
jgi:phage terminase Nu1 subunit (DNA packaging protein)